PALLFSFIFCPTPATTATYTLSLLDALPILLGNEAAPATAMIPIAVSGGLHFRSISAGLNHTCGVTLEGTLYCWGYNDESAARRDRKSTRLNSSHVAISYAVFCLKKKIRSYT